MPEDRALIEEFDRRIRFLLSKVQPHRRLNVVADLLAGRSAVDIFAGVLDQITVVTHVPHLKDLEESLHDSTRDTAARTELLRKVLADLVADQIKMAVNEAITRELPASSPSEHDHRSETEDGDEITTVEIALAEQVSASQLSALLELTETLYVTILWVDSFEESGDALARLRREDVLWVEKLEIGTPNRLKLRGRTKAILRVAAFITAVLAAPVAATEAYKNYAEARQAIVETALKQLELDEKMRQLEEKRRISFETRAKATGALREVMKKGPDATAILPPQRIKVGKP